MRTLFFTLLAIATSSAADWPHWRGPSRSGITDETSGFVDGRWLADKPLWTADVGIGASSPLVVGDAVYTLGRIGGSDVLNCRNAVDGKERWSAKYKAPEYA